MFWTLEHRLEKFEKSGGIFSGLSLERGCDG